VPTGTLPASGKKLWEKVYNDSKAAGDSEEKAAKKAWGAVHNAGWKKDAKGNWVKSSFTEFSMRIDRASYDTATNKRKIKIVASDTDEDKRGDNMSLELFNDFIDRIKRNEAPPEEYKSEYWNGGEPYISLSHYLDGNGKTVPGIINSTYVDKSCLKSNGEFADTPLGRKCFEVICSELYGENKNRQDKIRVSIAFLDYMHKHKSNGFVYDRLNSEIPFCSECVAEAMTKNWKGLIFLKGLLIHEALTRVPVNTRTGLEVEKSMAEEILTRKDDATSIVGEELADEVIKENSGQIVGKSETLVIKSDEEVSENPEVSANAEIAEKTEITPEEIIDATEDDELDQLMEADVEKSDVIPVAIVAPIPENEVYEPPLPYGGATSLKQVLDLQDAKHSFWDIDDLWYMTQNIKENIMASDEITDKGKAINSLLDEFKKEIKTKSGILIEDAKTKTVGGKSRPASDFLVVEDANKPSTWHLPVKVNGKPNHNLMRSARAALTSNFRGHSYAGPKKGSALAKLKRLYASEKMKWESETIMEEGDDMTKDEIISIVKSAIAEALPPKVEPVEVPKHVLDASFSEFKSKFDAVMNSEATPEEKLQQIQEPFNTFGTSLVSVVKSVAKPKEVTPESAAQDSLVKALSQVLNPLTQKLDMLLTQQNNNVPNKPMPQIPQRRSISPELLAKTDVVVKSETPNLRKIIDASVP